MKLRTHINIIVGFFSAGFIALVVSAELDSTRQAVREEIAGTNAVAAQVVGHLANTTDATALVAFLESLGRVRANDITVRNANGQLLYQSPLSTYKVGREAPKWFVNILLASAPTREFQMRDGAKLTISANASRAILDGWDDMLDLLVIGVVTLSILNGVVFWWVGRALAPLPIIATGLSRLRHGELQYRLPLLTGSEAREIGLAFNDMATAMEEKVHAERHAREAEARLDERREMTQVIEKRLDEERRMIARELHDEFAQSVTAIRSLAVSIATQVPSDSKDLATIGEAANLISSEAANLYDAMHGLIPRLMPLNLDKLGLADTLRAFISDWQKRNSAIAISLHQHLPATVGPSVALAIYRVVQEGLINALRHGQPTNVDITVTCDDQRIVVKVVDDGVGLSADWSRPGRFGLRGLQERLEQLHGSLQVRDRETNGVEIVAEIPMQASPMKAAT